MGKDKYMKVLFMCPRFFGYQKYIKKCLQEKNYHVKMLYTNKPRISFFFRLLYKLFPTKKEYFFNKYLKLHLNHKKFDVLFVIKGDNLNDYFFNLIDYSKIEKRVLYQWDSIENSQNAKNIEKYFTRILTFDIEDSKSQKWIYRPLFYIEKLCKPSKKTINIMFNGTLHSQRLSIAKKISQYTNTSISLLVSRLYYLKEVYINKNINFIANRNYFTFRRKSIKQMYELYSKSNIIIDYSHPNQTGISMRTFEAYRNNCKIITNNRNIMNEKIYNPDWVLVFDSVDSLVIPESWLVNKNSERIFTKGYEIHDWINDILF